MSKADIGLIGLAVMGENLVLNIESKGFTVAVYNRTTSKVDDFIGGRAAGKNIIGTHSVEELCANLERPRRVMIMVKAGDAVEKTIESLLPYLEEGDIIIDGGNSEFPDSIRRTDMLAEKASCLSAQASPVARRAPCSARASCQAATPPHGPQ